MPQFRYVAHFQQMVRRSSDPNTVIAIAAVHAPKSHDFAAEPGSRCNQQKPSALLSRWRRGPMGPMDLTATTGRATDITATVRATTDPRITVIMAGRITDPDMGPMPIMVMARRTIGTAIGGIGNRMAGAWLRAFHCPATACDSSPADCQLLSLRQPASSTSMGTPECA
jgi:hypothetical protein